MEWVKELIQRITCFIPRPQMLFDYQAGVRITWGRRNKVISSGLFWYIPLFQEIIYMDIQTQVVDLRGQSVHTKDGKHLIVSGAIQYSIKDIYKAVFNVQNVDQSLETLALGIILEYINKRTLLECSEIGELKREILKGIKDAAFGWGCKIERVYITDLDESRNIRLIGQALNHDQRAAG